MTATAAVLQMHQRDAFERNVTRAVAAGAGAGALYFGAQRVGIQLPLTYLALTATALACIRGDKMDRSILAILALVLPAIPWSLGVSHAWTVDMAGALTGALLVRAHLCERGEEGQVGTVRPGPLNFVLGGVMGAGMALTGFQVAKVLSARLGDFDTPMLLVALASGAILALFAALSSVAAHLALRPDPVEARCDELLPKLSGEFHTLASRALTLYRQCGKALAVLPREPAREELARTLSRMTRDAVELAAEWSGVEEQLEERAQKELTSEITDLLKSARAAKDPIARKQLELAVESLQEEIVRLEELKLRRERIIAKLKAQVALLERARVALIGMRSGQTQLKAAELAALSRKFNALATAQGQEAQIADAEATRAELGELEKTIAENRLNHLLEPAAPELEEEPVKRAEPERVVS